MFCAQCSGTSSDIRRVKTTRVFYRHVGSCVKLLQLEPSVSLDMIFNSFVQCVGTFKSSNLFLKYCIIK